MGALYIFFGLLAIVVIMAVFIVEMYLAQAENNKNDKFQLIDDDGNPIIWEDALKTKGRNIPYSRTVDKYIHGKNRPEKYKGMSANLSNVLREANICYESDILNFVRDPNWPIHLLRVRGIGRKRLIEFQSIFAEIINKVNKNAIHEYFRKSA